ncbi:hypothetical protein DPEC_G00102000 [Dallia pectoralis]|uniref:Uncharacterized protein n=1 Tax=Dallia pectoralis TaxID=75939 RepID=A0ACC2GWU3_DALPE|nr:hypothetical protein DPEC_G00102000 [Dallia pectoralis]
MEDCDYLQAQLTTILNSLVKTAVVELLRVVRDNVAEVRLEVSQSKLENQALKIENESNKHRLWSLEKELSTAETRPCSNCRGGCFSPNTDGKYSAGPITFSEDKNASWLQQSESAHTVEKITAVEKDEKKYLIKKEPQVDIHARKDAPVLSGGDDTNKQPCPKVEKVFDKDWSPSLSGDGYAFKEEDDDSSDLDDEDSPGPSAIYRQWLTPGQSGSVNLQNHHAHQRRSRRRRGAYLKYTPKQRAKVARMCMEFGAQMAAEMMSQELGRRISPNTVRSMRISYEQAVKSMGVQNVEDLPHLRRQIYMFDEEISLFVLARRRAGAKVSPSTLMVAMRDIVSRRNPEMLAENGGHIVVSTSWARSWLRRNAGRRIDLKS